MPRPLSPSERRAAEEAAHASSPEALKVFHEAEAAVRREEWRRADETGADGPVALPTDHPLLVAVRAAHEAAFQLRNVALDRLAADPATISLLARPGGKSRP
jgi:hypothetical protein